MRRLLALAALALATAACSAGPMTEEYPIEIYGGAVGHGVEDRYFLDIGYFRPTPTGRVYSSQRIEVSQTEFARYRNRANACWSAGHIQECRWN
jgi:hypothetical protein